MEEIISGRITEVGNLDHGTGFVLQLPDGPVAIFGLSTQSVAAVARLLYRNVTVRVTVEPADSEAGQKLLNSGS